MSTQQREAILVILHLLHRDIPSLYRVALLAVRSHLAAMNICVTVRAILAYVRKHGLNVAFDTFHFFVHSAQRIIGLVVIELGYRADGLPTGGRVTVLTRDS
jgi:hypothetical protein